MLIDPDKIKYLAACGVIFNEKREVLLIMRNDMPMWELVGGVVDEGETHEQAVIREAKEEIGNDVTIRNHLGVVYRRVDNDDTRDDAPVTGESYRHYQFYELELSPSPIVVDEHVTHEWFPFDRLPKNIAPLQRLMIEHTYHDKKMTEMVTDLISGKAHVNKLTAEEIYRLDSWQKHPKVRAKSKTSKMRSKFLPIEE